MKLTPLPVGGHPFRKRNGKGPHMTLIAGIVCKDSIVLASDSRTTIREEYVFFRDDAAKIGVVELAADGGRRPRALIAQSGNADMSARTIEIIERLAKDKPLSDYRAVADMRSEEHTSELQSL